MKQTISSYVLGNFIETNKTLTVLSIQNLDDLQLGLLHLIKNFYTDEIYAIGDIYDLDLSNQPNYT